MADCSPETLLEASKCFRCLPRGSLFASRTDLLCRWVNKQPSGCSDPDADDWVLRILAAGGAAPSAETYAAVCAFITECKALGVWADIYILNVFVPDNLVAAITPLKYYPGGLPSWQNFNFVGGDLSAEGLAGNAIDKYLKTGTGILDIVPLGTETDTPFSTWLVTTEDTHLGSGAGDLDVDVGEQYFDGDFHFEYSLSSWVPDIDRVKGVQYVEAVGEAVFYLNVPFGGYRAALHILQYSPTGGTLNLYDCFSPANNITARDFAALVFIFVSSGGIYLFARHHTALGGADNPDAFSGRRISFYSLQDDLPPFPTLENYKDSIIALRNALGGGWP